MRKARDQWLASGGVLTTTDYVIDETLTTLRFRLGLMRPKRGGSKSTAHLACALSPSMNPEANVRGHSSSGTEISPSPTAVAL